MTLILASQSAGRIAMLKAAGVAVEAVPALVDEDSIKISLTEAGAKPRDIADALAEAKARKVSRKVPTALVLGCDQICVGADGHVFDKPKTPEDARAHLARPAGAQHVAGVNHHAQLLPHLLRLRVRVRVSGIRSPAESWWGKSQRPAPAAPAASRPRPRRP